MRYVHSKDLKKARRLVDFGAVGSIHKSGNVTGMQRKYGWEHGGQVRVGGYIYNIGWQGVDRLRDAGLLRGD